MADYVQRSTSSLSNAVKIHYDKRLIEWTEKTVAFYQFAEKRPIPLHGGKTIDFTMVRPIAVGGTITESTTPSQKWLSADKIQLTLQQLGDYVKVGDYVDMTSITPMVAAAIKKLRAQAAETIDKFIGHNLFCYTKNCPTKSALAGVLKNTYSLSGTGDVATWLFWSGQGTYDGFPIYKNKARQVQSVEVQALGSSALTVKAIRHAVTVLRARNIKPFADGKYVAIARPEAVRDLRDAAGWKDWHAYTHPEAMYNGEVGYVEGCRFVQQTAYGSWTLTGDTMSTSGTLYATLIFGQGAYGVTELGGLKQIVTRPNNYDSGNPLGLWSTIGWQTKMAACTLNKSAGVIILSNIV